MFERFTVDARKIVVVAQEHASALRHNYIGTAHLLLALTDDETGPVAQALTALNVSVAELRAHLTESNPPGAEEPTGHIPFTPRFKAALDNSFAEAVKHNSPVVDVAALGAGLTLVDGGAAAHTLQHFGITPTQLRDQITRHRAETTPAAADPASPRQGRRRGHRPHDATSLHPDQLVNVSVTFIKDQEDQAVVCLPNGSHTTVGYGALASASDYNPATPDASAFGIYIQFLGDRDGQALVRLPNQSETTLDYTALTIHDDPHLTGAPEGSPTVSCPNCDWSYRADSLQDAMEAFNTHHAEQHPERYL
jgi:hypothetical protein